MQNYENITVGILSNRILFSVNNDRFRQSLSKDIHPLLAESKLHESQNSRFECAIKSCILKYRLTGWTFLDGEVPMSFDMVQNWFRYLLQDHPYLKEKPVTI